MIMGKKTVKEQLLRLSAKQVTVGLISLYSYFIQMCFFLNRFFNVNHWQFSLDTDSHVEATLIRARTHARGNNIHHSIKQLIGFGYTYLLNLVTLDICCVHNIYYYKAYFRP